MEQAKMAHSTDTANSSDDLIAELARLMAEDAQGSEPSQPAGDTRQSGQSLPSDRMNKLQSENVVPMQARKAAPRVAPVVDRTPEAEVHASLTNDLADLIQEQIVPQRPAGAGAAKPSGADMPGRPAVPNGADLKDAAKQSQVPAQVEPASPVSSTGGQAEEAAPALPVDDDSFNFDPIAALIEESETEQQARSTKEDDEQARSAAIRAEAVREAKARAAAEHEVEAERQRLAELEAHLSVGQEREAEKPAAALAAENTAAPQNGERNDGFATPPVFGLGTSPTPRKPATPLDEIENLIGDAVRVGVQARQVQEAAGEPPTPTARGPVAGQGIDDAADAAEAAILAAAQASNQAARRMEDRLEPEMAPRAPQGDLDEALLDRDSDFVPRRSRWRAVAPVLTALVLLAGAGGAYWYFGMNGGAPDTVPFLASNTADAKVEAQTPAQPDNSANSAVFSQLDGATNDQAPAEQLVSRDQSEDALGSSDIRQVEADDTAGGLANRKVRTVTVRPDGTIVTGDDAVAANEVLPVDRPNVPALPGTTGAADDSFSVASTGGTPAGTDQAASADEGQAATMESLIAAANATEDSSAGTIDAASADAVATPASGETVAVTPGIPLPMPRPADRIASAPPQTPTAPSTPARVTTPSVNNNARAVDLIAGAANDAVATQSVRSTPVVSTPADPSGQAATGPFVQLASQRSAEAADSSLSILTERYQSLFGGEQAFVKTVDLGDQGVFYRVLVPAASLQNANDVCTNVKAAGGDCFVRSN